MKLILPLLMFCLVLLSCGIEPTIKLKKNDSVFILNKALASRSFLQEQLTHKKFDTIYFVKSKLLPVNANLNQDYFKFFYVDSSQSSTTPTRIFFAPDKRIRIGIKKFELKNDTISLSLKNYGAEFIYLFKFNYDGKNWKLIYQNSDTSY